MNDDPENLFGQFFIVTGGYPETHFSFPSHGNKPNDYGLRAALNKGSLNQVLEVISACPENQRLGLIRDGFFYASFLGATNFVSLFLQLGTDLHAEDELALRLAAKAGHAHVVKLLLDQGANPNAPAQVHFRLQEYARDYPMYEALVEAAIHGHRQVVEVLLQNRANANIRDYSAIKNAAEKSYIHILQDLHKNGADIFSAMRLNPELFQKLSIDMKACISGLMARDRADLMTRLSYADDPLIFLTRHEGLGYQVLWLDVLRMNLLTDVAELLKARGFAMRPDVMLRSVTSDGTTLAKAAAQNGRLYILSDPELWTGNLRGLLDVFKTLSSAELRQGGVTPERIEKIQNILSENSRRVIKTKIKGWNF